MSIDDIWEVIEASEDSETKEAQLNESIQFLKDKVIELIIGPLLCAINK